jgi:acetyl-CoA carboxylase biotin carboxylase subunit
MRTARRLGIPTVAVYSEVDARAMHVAFADEAYCIGPAPSAQSYLRGDKIIETARRSGADAIHPGFGFLSENPSFCRAVKEAGLTFVGPSPEAMELMGGKLSAKAAVKAYGVPLAPGGDEPIRSPDAARQLARSIGFPVMLKASAGGGGKGMRIVENPDDFDDLLRLAQSEALSAFGDDAVFVEKFVPNPRHVEIQILADTFGNVTHLFERECSIQRRHQKLVEEAPAAWMDDELRRKMGAAAINVARAARYTGAGTVEFLVDEHRNFYFLEMNARIQVEHPVTEMITGVDIVEEQLRVADGQSLSFRQDDLAIRGHAVELRVCAEDPANGFLPDVGVLELFRPPRGPGIRVDSGVREGDEVPIYYDPMLAKLIVWGENRTAALNKMTRAIDKFVVSGVKTTLDFGRFVVMHPKFVSAEFDTGFVAKYFRPEMLKPTPTEKEMLAAAAAAVEFAPRPLRPLPAKPLHPWRVRRG